MSTPLTLDAAGCSASARFTRRQCHSNVPSVCHLPASRILRQQSLSPVVGSHSCGPAHLPHSPSLGRCPQRPRSRIHAVQKPQTTQERPSPSASPAPPAPSPGAATRASPSEARLALPPHQAALSWWQSQPSRYKLLVAACGSFVLCNMNKINLSVAIIPMALDFGWSPSVSGTVQAAFFYGYLLCQLPGGYLASLIGGRKLLAGGVVLFSAMTCATPLLATTIPGLCIARAGVGLGESVAPSAAVDMIARVVPQSERSRAMSFVFGGLHVGSIVGLLAAPALIHATGWQSLFIVFGAAGLAWWAWYEALISQIAEQDPEFACKLSMESDEASHGTALSSGMFDGVPLILSGDDRPDAVWYGRSTGSIDLDGHEAGASGGGGGGHAGTVDPAQSIPYRAFLRSTPVQALCFTHFCHNWMHYTMLAWLPTYFTSTLSVDLMHAAQTALLPPLAGIAASALAGPLADGLIARGMPISHVRKLVQGASFLGPCLFLLLASSDLVEGDRTATVACITAALGMSSFSLAGLYCTHGDMSPRYCAPLLGLTNTAGAVPGIIGVTTVGYLYDATGSWDYALFLPSALFMVAGAYAYIFHASNERIEFDRLDNSPFAWEQRLPQRPSWLRFPWESKSAVKSS